MLKAPVLRACSAVRRKAGEFLVSGKGVVSTGFQVTHNKAFFRYRRHRRANRMDLRDLGSPADEVIPANGQVDTAGWIRRSGLTYTKDQ